MGISLLNLLPPTSCQCLSHPQLCQCNGLWFCLKTGGVMWTKLNKHYKLKKVDELTENFCCWELASSFSYCMDHPQEFLKADHMSLEVFFLKGGWWLSSIYFHITKEKLWKCRVVELESWSLLMVLDGLQHSSRIPGSSLCSAWHGILLLACFAVQSVKTEGHPRSCHWCCQDSRQRWHSLCKALRETGMKAKHSSLLKTF